MRKGSALILLCAAALVAAAACGGGKKRKRAGPGGDWTRGDSGPRDADSSFDCAGIPALPATFTTLRGFSGAEDFAFDRDGNLVSVHNDNLTKQPQRGNPRVFVPNLGESAGVAYLPNGDLMVTLMGDYSLVRISPNGSYQTTFANLEYPNGLETDREGYVYVSEQDAGRVRRIDPTTGDAMVVAEGLFNPNGISFGPSYRDLFVCSFGGGVVYRITRDASGNWQAPVVFGRTPDGPQGQQPFEACAGKNENDACTSIAGGGTCEQITNGGLACSSSFSSEPSLEFVRACKGLSPGVSCTVSLDGQDYGGSCRDGWGDLVCFPEANLHRVCEGELPGAACFAADPWVGYVASTCRMEAGDLICGSLFGEGGERGGLDGLTVDACGNVYVTEYVAGIIWRFPADGQTAEKVAEPPSSWIPNLHWGAGFGGWDPLTLYVMDRDEGRLFGLAVGVPERPRVYP